MKRFYLILITFIFCSLAMAQSPTLTNFRGKVQFNGFTNGGTSNAVGNLESWSDQTNQYFANAIAVGDVLWDNNGNRWEVMVVNSSNLFSANVDLRDINSVGGIPSGIGFVSRETETLGLSLLVPDNNIGISQQLKSRIESHNMMLIDLYMKNNGDPGCKETVTQASHGFSVGDILGQTAGNGAYFIASTTDGTTLPVAFVCEVVDVDNFKVSSEGWVFGTHPYTAGNDYFVQDAAGTYTTSADADFHIFAFRAYGDARYYDIPELVSGGGGGTGTPDGNGIYSGSGTVPAGTVANLVDDFDIVAGPTTKLELDQNAIRLTAASQIIATGGGIMGFTHTGPSGFLTIESLDRRSSLKGQQTTVTGEDELVLDAASGNTEILVEDGSIKLGPLTTEATTTILGLNASRQIVETTVAGGAGDDWGAQVVVTDATLTGNGTVGSPLAVAPGADLNGIISALPLGDVDIVNAGDNDLNITQGNGHEFDLVFGVGAPLLRLGDLTNGDNTAIDKDQFYVSDANGNNTSYENGNIRMDVQNGVINPILSEFMGGDLTLRQANGTATGNLFPQIRLKQYGDGYPRIVLASGDDANNDKNLFDTDPIINGRRLGSIQYQGQHTSGDATNDANNAIGARIDVFAEETFSASASGTLMSFTTTPIGSNLATSSMILENDGQLRLASMPAKSVSTPVFDYQMGASGHLVKTSATHSGLFSGSTDASGLVTITHELTSEPVYGDLKIQSSTTPYFVTITAVTSTTITFKVWDAVNGTAVASTGITARWIVK